MVNFCEDLSGTNHGIILASIPTAITTDKGVTIQDEKAHYTPLYMAPRLNPQDNELPQLIRDIVANMMGRKDVFDISTLAKSAPALSFG